ncbi:DNA-3-methyladenine glycosylase 2 family protein [Halorubraceae archaeon YAN]|nr:DNA-3-methyladenine glycosylase 2 family protein [Halorubraceae archaeon YAN]
MERGAIDLATLDGAFDLQSTVESGQSYLWNRSDGQMYAESDVYGGDAWYETVVSPIPGVSDVAIPVRVRQQDGSLHWESTADAVPILTHILRLDDDLDAIEAKTPPDAMLGRAFDRYAGMRLVRDPAFPSLISFICSAQMRVSRIHQMQRSLMETYGEPIELGDNTYYSYPTAEELAARTEDDLRDLSLGYRAPYVQRTAEMVATEGADPYDAQSLPYEEARELLTQFVGVGDKVSDCVLLFSLGFTEPVPLDTWIQTAIAEYYPDCEKSNYMNTSRAIRERFGGEFAGYVQTYVFHHLRNGGE